MKNKNRFSFSILAQVEYFAKIVQMIASENNIKSNLEIDKTTTGSILCVVINDSYYMYSDLISAARKAWFVDDKKIKKVEYVCAVCDCTVVGVFRLLNQEESAEKGRDCLNIEIADIEMQKSYLGRRLDGKNVNGAIFYM